MTESNLLSLIFDAHKIIEVGGILLILLIVYLETGFFLGLVLPGGDYLLFATGLFCGSHYLDIPLLWLLALLIGVAFLGDLTGYLKGRWLGSRLFTDNKSRFFKMEYLERSKQFYSKYGAFAFIMGRFMPVIRTLIPMLAGASTVPFGKFLIYNALGSVIWIGTLVPLGYFLGEAYPQIIDYAGYLLILFIVIASAPMLKILVFNKKQHN